MALELTLGHSVTIQVTEPDENSDSRNGCFSYRPATITMQPMARSTASPPPPGKLGSVKFGGRGNTLRIDGVNGGQPDRSRPVTAGCPVGYEPDGGTLVLPGAKYPWQ